MAGPRNQASLMDRSRVEGFEDVDCVGEDGVIEAHVHKIVHSVAAAVASRGAIRAIPELAAGALQRVIVTLLVLHWKPDITRPDIRIILL